MNESNEEYWQAVVRRDRGADGQFVLAVRTTGIYCRPSCPARQPRRENVTFYPSTAAAAAAGFRACLRCRPDSPPGPSPQQRAVVDQACALLGAAEAPLSLGALGAAVGSSPAHLQRLFKRVVGVTPRQYAAAQRVARLKEGLHTGETVTNAMYDAGYGSSSRLYESAPTALGMTPATYRRRGAGMDIAHTVISSPLGRLLVAATERGVCAVYLGDSDAPLLAALAAEYPAATITPGLPDAPPLAAPVAALLRHLAGQQPALDLPLDVQATAFQAQVWAALRAIPYGETRTYGALAASLGRPTAARAVGAACGANPVSILIPCHRAVGASGALTGYRWGTARKARLLAGEQGTVDGER